MPSIREACMEDLEILGQIAHQTGFFGSSAGVFFPSEPLFTDLWIRPYLEGAGCCNFLTESEGRVLGYIIGSCSLSGYQQWFAQHIPLLLAKALGGSYPNLWKSLPYLLRMARYPSKPAPTARFPAQLHINLLPQSRGSGLGQQLMETYLDCLRARRIPGVQLSTTTENRAAIKLYERNGFRIFTEYQSPLWQPWLGRDTIHLVMTKELV